MEVCIVRIILENSHNVKTVNVVTQIFDRFVGYRNYTRVVRKRVSFQDRKNENTPKFPSIEI